MADFFDGKTIRKSVHTPTGEANGWIKVDGNLPDGVPVRHLKIENGEIVEMTQAEKDIVDAPYEPTEEEKLKSNAHLLMKALIDGGAIKVLCKNSAGNQIEIDISEFKNKVK